VAAGNAEARTDLFNAEVIAGWMFLNHVLSVKGFLCARRLFPETGDTIITEEVRKVPTRV
jgi:hypothetical protein